MSDAGPPVLVAGHPVPERLAAGRAPELVRWRSGLPGAVEDLLERWELTAEAPFLPGGSSAWVAPVRTASGGDQALKVAWAHDEARDEAAGMLAWQGRGAARLVRSERRGETAALLMERVRPGTPLAELLTWPERDEVIVQVVRRLWVRPEELSGSGAGRTDGPRTVFRPLAEMCAWWADEAQHRADAGGSPLPRDLVAQGLKLFRELPEQWDGESVLLATDLHPSNVLAAAPRPGVPGPGREERAAGAAATGQVDAPQWVLIDPKPYVGDPHYDLLQHMLNDPGRLQEQPGPFADRMASLAGLDPHRLRRWLLARCVQEAGVIEGAAEAARVLADSADV